MRLISQMAPKKKRTLRIKRKQRTIRSLGNTRMAKPGQVKPRKRPRPRSDRLESITWLM